MRIRSPYKDIYEGESITRKGASVSMPIFWEELDEIAPDQITLRNIEGRLKKEDPWQDFRKVSQSGNSGHHGSISAFRPQKMEEKKDIMGNPLWRLGGFLLIMGLLCLIKLIKSAIIG